MNYADYMQASTLIHAVQGAAFILLAAVGLIETRRPGTRLLPAGPAFLLAAAAAGPLIIAALPGDWSFRGLSDALVFRSGFRMFIAISSLLGAAGLCGLMASAAGPRTGLWRWLFLIFLLLTGAAYLLVPWRVNAEARSDSLADHSVIGVLLMLGAASGAGFLLSSRRQLLMAGLVLTLLSGVSLLAYRETEAAYGPRMVSFTSTPAAVSVPSPSKNAASADKKRPGN